MAPSSSASSEVAPRSTGPLVEQPGRLTEFVEAMPGPVALLDDEWRILTHSRQWLTVFRNEDSETHNPISLNRIESGTARTSVDETHPVPTEGRAFFDVFEDADDTWHDTFFRCLEEKRRQNGYERRLSRIDGPTYWVDWEIRPWQTKTGEQRGLLLSVVDRSEEREAKRLRRQVDRRFDALLDTIGEGVLLMDDEGVFRDGNEKAEKILGRSLDEIVGSRFDDDIWTGLRPDGTPLPNVEFPFWRAYVERAPILEEVMGIYPPDAPPRWLSINSQPLFREGQEAPYAVLITFTDVTERKEAEARIREQAQLLDKARDAILARDMDGRIVYWNKGAERLTGWSKEEMLGARARECLYDPSDEDKLQQCQETMMAEGEWTGELRMRTEGDEERIVESRWSLVRDESGDPKHVLVINTDVTERKRLESQFLRSQRMESLGRLVGGIAHDLGNLLVPITLGVKVLKRRVGDTDDKVDRTLSMIQKSAERGSDMVEQVLAFARGVEGERVALQPGMIVEEVEEMTDETFPEDIEVRTQTEEDLRPIVGDATQIQQVLMNLCVNARDAMPNGGTLSIEARNVDFTEEEARRNIDAEPGPYVCIEVEDTGTGMPDDVVDKIFEPFFSTKEEDEGTGLGLSTAYSIIQSHDGFLDVESEEGVGTTFWIYLPVAEEEEIEEASSAGDDAVEAEPSLSDGDGLRVLVVDDEEFVLESAEQTLESVGYEVRTALDAAAALRMMDKDDEAIDLVVTDLRMPGMSGLELIRALRGRHPDLPIVAASGVADGRTDEALEAGAQTFLAKPFTAEKLEGALQEALRSSEEAAA